MRCFHGPCIAALHVWVALMVPGCVHGLALDRLVYACFMY